MTGLGEPFQILLPQAVLVLAQLMQPLPGIDPGTVAIVEKQADGVIADRLDMADVHVLLADLEYLLPRPMAADLGRRRIHPQVFAGKPEMAAVIERDRKSTR